MWRSWYHRLRYLISDCMACLWVKPSPFVDKFLAIHPYNFLHTSNTPSTRCSLQLSLGLAGLCWTISDIFGENLIFLKNHSRSVVYSLQVSSALQDFGQTTPYLVQILRWGRKPLITAFVTGDKTFIKLWQYVSPSIHNLPAKLK